MSVEITVRGAAERRAKPEQAKVFVAVESDGGSRDGVFQAVRDTAATLSSQLSQAKADGAVAEWSNDQLRTWSYRPWEKPGRRGALVHHARIELRAVFGDIEAMSGFLADAVTLEGVAVSHVEWSLTDEHRDDMREQARAEAVADAVAKANSYARNLGLGDVRPVAVADTGMLDGPGHDQPPMALAAAYRSSAPESAGSGIEFVPQDITVSVAVDARFLAG